MGSRISPDLRLHRRRAGTALLSLRSSCGSPGEMLPQRSTRGSALAGVLLPGSSDLPLVLDVISEVCGENTQTLFYFHPLHTDHEHVAQLRFEELFSVIDSGNSKKPLDRLNRVSRWSTWGKLMCIDASYWEPLQLASETGFTCIITCMGKITSAPSCHQSIISVTYSSSRALKENTTLLLPTICLFS